MNFCKVSRKICLTSFCAAGWRSSFGIRSTKLCRDGTIDRSINYIGNWGAWLIRDGTIVGRLCRIT